MPTILCCIYLPWPSYRPGQGKYSHISLSPTVLLTNVANVNDPLQITLQFSRRYLIEYSPVWHYLTEIENNWWGHQIGRFFHQFGYFWKLSMIFENMKLPKEMATFCVTFCFSKFITFFPKQLISEHGLFQALKIQYLVQMFWTLKGAFGVHILATFGIS